MHGVDMAGISYPNTPMAKAIIRLFDALEALLVSRDLPDGCIRAYIFGGAAVHIYTVSRSSSDVDVEFQPSKMSDKEIKLIAGKVPPIDYDDPQYGASTLELDATFTSALGVLHEDYTDRAVLLERAGPLEIFLPSPEDLALSKLDRLSEQDVLDMINLLSLPIADVGRFHQIAIEAIAVQGNSVKLTGHLKYVMARISEG